MKSRWVKAIATSALMSPRGARGEVNKSAIGEDETASSITPIPLPVLATLTRIIEFLDEYHFKEEGLYSKPGVRMERKEILRLCQKQQVPDLSVYSPHSIASAVKEMLNDLYEPLIPANVSHQLLEAASSGRIDDREKERILEAFKQIRSTTRDFLQVFLGHLNHVSSSGLSRMSVTSIALHIGIGLIRPSEDRTILSSKAMMRRRKCVGEFLIRKASSLPYDCATEMNIPAIPELVSTAVTDTADINPPPSVSSQQLHYIQATWDIRLTNFTPGQLEEMFGRFGEIENLGINDQGNRAIIAYNSAASAEEAEHATIPYVRIRQRKPRQSEKRREYSPKHRKPDSTSPHSDTIVTMPALPLASGNVLLSGSDSSEPKREVVQTIRRRASRLNPKHEATVQPQQEKVMPLEDIIIVEDIEDNQLAYEDGNSAGTCDRQDKADSNENAVTGTTTLNMGNSGLPNVENLVKNDLTKHTFAQLGDDIKLDSTRPGLDQKHGSMESSIISDGHSHAEDEHDKAEVASNSPHSLSFEKQFDAKKLKLNNSTMEISTADHILHESTADNLREHLVSKSNVPDIESSLQLPCPSNLQLQSLSSTIGSVDLNLKTDEEKNCFLGHSVQALEAPILIASQQNVIPTIVEGNCLEHMNNNAAIQSKLLDMEKILTTSTAALSTTARSNQFERAVLQLHKQILEMVFECLVLAGVKNGEVAGKSLACTAVNAEFLDFLEAQSKTQIKILEVEMRAGQELLRLHKTQYEKERVELEEEITTLRVGRAEAERLCAELRRDLRKCRSELACHVANATDIQRQKSALEEKLAVSQNQLHAKDVALTKLQAEYDKMYEVATKAQSRLEHMKRGDNNYDDDKTNLGSQDGSGSPLVFANAEKNYKRVRVDTNLPRTTNFLSKYLTGTNITVEASPPEYSPQGILPVSRQSSNVAALQAMKQQMGRDIQEQIASTKAALREMEICSSNGKTLEEEEEELRQLQQQLADKSSEMDAAMNESRTKFQELHDPATVLRLSNNPSAYDKLDCSQEPTIFDSSALVNEMINRAERVPSRTRSDGIPDSCSSIHAGYDPFQHLQPVHNAQSTLYKRWTADRSFKMAQLAKYRDQKAVVQAQQSMQAFQKKLSEIREQQ